MMGRLVLSRKHPIAVSAMLPIWHLTCQFCRRIAFLIASSCALFAVAYADSAPLSHSQLDQKAADELDTLRGEGKFQVSDSVISAYKSMLDTYITRSSYVDSPDRQQYFLISVRTYLEHFAAGMLAWKHAPGRDYFDKQYAYQRFALMKDMERFGHNGVPGSEAQGRMNAQYDQLADALRSAVAKYLPDWDRAVIDKKLDDVLGDLRIRAQCGFMAGSKNPMPDDALRDILAFVDGTFRHKPVEFAGESADQATARQQFLNNVLLALEDKVIESTIAPWSGPKDQPVFMQTDYAGEAAALDDKVRSDSDANRQEEEYINAERKRFDAAESENVVATDAQRSPAGVVKMMEHEATLDATADQMGREMASERSVDRNSSAAPQPAARGAIFGSIVLAGACVLALTLGIVHFLKNRKMGR